MPTLGQKITHFLFHSPTESDVGLPPAKEHFSKDEALEKIEYAWGHPLHPQKKTHPEKPKHDDARDQQSHKTHKTLGEKLSHFLFDVPHDSDLGLPAPKKHLSKEEALAKIEYAWDHPLNPQKKGPKESRGNKNSSDRHEHHHKTLGQKVSHFLFHSPTDSELGLPPPKENLTKEEALKRIESAWDHPLRHQK